MTSGWEDSEISSGWKIGYAVLCLSVFGVFAALSQPDRGVVAGFSTASIVLAAKLRWDAHEESWFWAILMIAVLTHALLVYAWGWRIVIKPTILLAPLALADFVVVISALFIAERLVGARPTE